MLKGILKLGLLAGVAFVFYEEGVNFGQRLVYIGDREPDGIAKFDSILSESDEEIDRHDAPRLLKWRVKYLKRTLGK